MTPEGAMEWLCVRTMPLWLEHGVDWKAGAFHEDLDPATLAPRATFRRLRVAARQVYVFAAGQRLGVARAGDALELGVAFLRHQARRPDGGYASRFDLSGQPLELPLDLYDHAFVLLAFAHAGERAAALEVMATIDTMFGHPACGWCESVPESLPRRQNPHMHLLEAVLAAAERFGEVVFLDRADTIVGLFLDRLYQPEGLPEYFDDALVPVRKAGCFELEPGHHHEWVWLLDEYRRISAAAGRPVRHTQAQAASLMQFAERHGVSADGIVAGVLWSDGRVHEAATRVWPHTERLKALSRTDKAGQGPALDTMFRFFEGVPAGLWTERWDGGFVRGDASPASTLYHITCAILEIQPRVT